MVSGPIQSTGVPSEQLVRHNRPSRPSLALSVASNWLALAVTSAVSFVLAPYMVNRLGDSQYGLWVMVGSLTGYLGLLDLGVRGAVTRYVARHHGAGDHGAASRIVSSALFVFATTAMTAVAAAGLLSLVLEHLFDVPPDLLQNARIALLLSGVTIAFSLVSGVFGGVVVGLERFDLLNTTEVTVELLRAALVWWALVNGGGLATLAMVQLGCCIVRGLIQAELVRRLYPGLRIRLGLRTDADTRTILSLGLSVTALHVASMLAFYTDAVVIGAFMPVAMVTFFAIGAGLTQHACALISGISHVISPRSSFLEQVGGPAAVRRILLASSRLATLVILPIVITFAIRGGSFIGLWMGPRFAVPSGRVLTVLSIALAFAVARHVIISALIGIDRHRGVIPVCFAEGVINVALSVALVVPLGIEGVAWGTTLPNLAVSLLFIPWYARRTLQIAVTDQIMQFWLRPLAAMVPFALATAATERFWPADGMALFFAQVSVALLGAAAGTWSVALSGQERRDLFARLGVQRMGRAGRRSAWNRP